MEARGWQQLQGAGGGLQRIFHWWDSNGHLMLAALYLSGDHPEGVWSVGARAALPLGSGGAGGRQCPLRGRLRRRSDPGFPAGVRGLVLGNSHFLGTLHSPGRPPRLAEALGDLPTIQPPLLLLNMGHGQQRAGLASALLPPGCLPLVTGSPSGQRSQPWPLPATSLRSVPIHSALANPSQQHSQPPRLPPPQPPCLCPSPPPLGATPSSPHFPLGLQSLSSITLPLAHSQIGRASCRERV